MIKLKDIQKSYGNKENSFRVLKDINLEIKGGNFVAVLGPSGSGKSTLLNVVSGLERPDSGSVIYYGGEDLTGMSDKELTLFRKINVGFIFQQYYLLPNLNVDKNVKMGADLSSNRDYRQIIEAVGLKDKLFKMPYELSGGEQQRVSVARALAKNPKVLFLDEPTGALDEDTGRLVLNYISKLQIIYNFTIVMVTHNRNIADMADTVVNMNSGRVVGVYGNSSRKTAFEIGW